MKKIKTFIVLALLSLSNLQAQSLAGYKIFINPGHGGHDSNDREIPLGNGVTFWESEGNLTKGLYLKTILESLGATVFMSRTTNTTADDIPVTQMAAIANSYNVDYFHAIHSNAGGGGSNYTLILFQGHTNEPTYGDALTVANYLADEIFKVNRTTRKMIAGDFDFYGTGQAYLGVFKWLNMPGTLSEGSMHDYTPESWRLKNDSYLKHEAWAIARAFLIYFMGGSFQNGIVAGILRDELETVPASYKPISGTLDNYKPINKVKVRLEPGGRIYNGDEFNNGYYFFDNVTPGNYKLFFDADGMKTDSVTTIVNINESVFNDKLLVLNPILDPPLIVNYSPADSLNEVSNISPIVIEFNIRMNVTETQNATTISPSIAGSFKWENDYKRLIFTPTVSYVPGTKYTVSISTAAKTYFGIHIQQQNTFNFTTRSKLNLISTYPDSSAADVSTSVLINVKFDQGIMASTLAYRVTLTDSAGNSVAVKVNPNKYSLGIIEFEPQAALKNYSLYRIILKAGIGDVENVTFPQDAIIEFRTENKYTFTGNVLEGFELSNVWQSPLLSPNTVGIINDQTNFTISTEREKSGNNAGKLTYGFSGNNGLVELALFNPIELGESSPAGFGLWVFGDNSKNILEYRFSRNNYNSENVKIDTINWTGWKLKKIWLNEIPGTGSIQFRSINVVQTGSGNTSGIIFFDECISNIITGVRGENSLPVMFLLEQNYPNPFNPSTKIKFSIPFGTNNAISHTTLKVYDMLGREIATLVNEDKAPGNYEVIFNAGGLASGMYIYRIQSGNFVESKKLILLK